MFAAAGRVSALMVEFERNVLARYTPCNFKERDKVVCALAEAHVELVLIHPFREGNGRAARVLSTLMALQAGLPLLDFSVVASEKKESYFAAVRAGLDRDYCPMEKSSLKLSSGASRSLDGRTFGVERFGDGRDWRASFDGG